MIDYLRQINQFDDIYHITKNLENKQKGDLFELKTMMMLLCINELVKNETYMIFPHFLNIKLLIKSTGMTV